MSAWDKPRRCRWCSADFHLDHASGGAPPAWSGATICRQCHDTKVPQTAPRECDVCERPILDPEWSGPAPDDHPRRAAWPKAKCHRECLEAWTAGAGRTRRAAQRAETEKTLNAKRAKQRAA